MTLIIKIEPKCETCLHRENITNQAGKPPVGKCRKTKNWLMVYEGSWCSDYDPTVEARTQIILETDNNKPNPLQGYWIIGFDYENSKKRTRLIPLDQIKEIYISDANEVSPEHPQYRKEIVALTSVKDREWISIYHNDDPDVVQAHFEQIIKELSSVLTEVIHSTERICKCHKNQLES